MFNRFLDTLKMYCQYFNIFHGSVKNPESNLPKSIYPSANRDAWQKGCKMKHLKRKQGKIWNLPMQILSKALVTRAYSIPISLIVTTKSDAICFNSCSSSFPPKPMARRSTFMMRACHTSANVLDESPMCDPVTSRARLVAPGRE